MAISIITVTLIPIDLKGVDGSSAPLAMRRLFIWTQFDRKKVIVWNSYRSYPGPDAIPKLRLASKETDVVVELIGGHLC